VRLKLSEETLSVLNQFRKQPEEMRSSSGGVRKIANLASVSGILVALCGDGLRGVAQCASQ
jgi:methyl coenzyme M reductase alpha subunit